MQHPCPFLGGLAVPVASGVGRVEDQSSQRFPAPNMDQRAHTREATHATSDSTTGTVPVEAQRLGSEPIYNTLKDE